MMLRIRQEKLETNHERTNSNRFANDLASDIETTISTTVEGWEKCLRERMENNPQMTVGLGLLAGIALGWLAKR